MSLLLGAEARLALPLPSLLDGSQAAAEWPAGVGRVRRASAALPLLVAVRHGHRAVAALFGDHLGELLAAAVSHADLSTLHALLDASCNEDSASADKEEEEEEEEEEGRRELYSLQDTCRQAIQAPRP